MASGETSGNLQQNDDTFKRKTSSSSALLQRSSLLSVRASVVQVIRELDLLLTVDTLIYLVQAMVELFLLSVRFAYEQQTLQSTQRKQRKYSAPVAHRSHRHPPRELLWKKSRQTARTQSPLPDILSLPVSPFRRKNTILTPLGVVDPFLEHSDTGSLPLATRPPRPVINPLLPPPPSLHTQLGTCLPTTLCPAPILPPSPASITDAKQSENSSPNPPLPSQPRPKKPPRRKPVQSQEGDRQPPVTAPESILLLATAGQTQSQIPATKAQPVEASSQSLDLVSTVKSTTNPIARKSSAKFNRPPILPSQPIIQVLSLDIASTVQSRPPEQKPVEQSLDPAETVERAPVRKSSAKFIRRPTQPPQQLQQGLSSVVASAVQYQHSKQNPSDKPFGSNEPGQKPIVRKSSAKFIRRPTLPSQQSQQDLSSSVAIQHEPSEQSRAEISFESKEPIQKLVRKSSAKFIRPPIQPSHQIQTEIISSELPEQKSVEQSFEFPVEIRVPVVQENSANIIRPSRQASEVSPPEHLPIIAPQPHLESAEGSLTLEQPQLQTSGEIIEPVPKRAVSQQRFSLFPPRPAIAVVQTSPEPVQNPVLGPTPPPLSFQELQPFVPLNIRQPPPLPSIPRFPSPQKSIAPSSSTPSSNPSLHLAPGHSQSPESARHASMVVLPSSSEDHPITEEASLHPISSEELAPPTLPQEWDPSEDDNIFTENRAANIPRTVVSENPDGQFSSHGSIDSSLSVETPPSTDSKLRLSSPNLMERSRHSRAVSSNSQYIPSPLPSPRARPHSAGSISSGSEYVPPAFLFDNTHLKPGNAAALLSHAETLNLYRQNAKKAVDNPATQYEFAIFMMDAARESVLDLNGASPTQREELLKEGLSILRRLADRGYPQAQYYLGDCYSNGIGCKNGMSDLEKAFPLFVLAAKHSHVEASFRTALAYEHGWGCRRDPFKALQFLRKAASANHPGAMLRLGKACLDSEFGMPNTQLVIHEGVNWLKRAVEAATPLYPNAPYELALLHEFGYKDVVFPDEAYAVQLFAKASDLGHPDAAYRLGDAYEYGRMGCPEDPALSIHYYSLSARGGNASAMLSLCAWYMVGAEGVLEKSDEEAFAWAQRAAELGLGKAEFATGYFLERGVGCRRDALEAWKYYVRAADHGDERAISRLKAGKDLNADRHMLASAAAAGSERSRLSATDSDLSGAKRYSPQKTKMEGEDDTKPKDKDCVVM